MSAAEETFVAAEQRLLEGNGTQVKSHFIAGGAAVTGVQQIHVLEAGRDDARPVVLIHGGNSVAAGWEPLISLLKDDFHLYAPDRPGCGLTDKLDYHGVPFREHGIGFVEAVLDGLNLKRASLVGNSMGGYWALLFAIAHPERVERLALIGEPAGSTPHPVFRLRLLGVPGLNRLLFATVLKPDRKRMRQRLQAVVANPERIPEDYLDLAYAGAVLPGAQLGWLSMIERIMPFGRVPQGMGTYGLRPELPQIKSPTLFVWGDRDFCPPEWGRQLCELMPEARMELLPDTGHLAWLDEPERVAGLVRDFLRA
jgi:pimeloyl-ACP methyl ester carboxylesterase